ncbi:F-box/LRR-repeat protein 8 isoform X2 [Latimeria chalumnae]|uniref:F-box/LRR-repeat protein 8 n=3 Tax=Latimeria chalumnae TaxID=7897 RepID=H3B7F1_LATCH|nr:PREDICTED: F-box/LRR-repeat protein 8 [Latimeria chalumnae]|eukprot:XP_005998088.1 PREDICTED: F-box/LRR-repeat protein 8 [Latimeria chalumnae]
MAAPSLLDLPEEVLAHVFSYLPLGDRCAMSLVCKSWAKACCCPATWYYTEVRCVSQEMEDGILWGSQNFLAKAKCLKIVLDQSEQRNRDWAIKILNWLAEDATKLKDLSIVCTGENPYFYSGRDILESIRSLCQKNGQTQSLNLHRLDLRKVPFTLDGELVRLVAASCPYLQSLFVNNHTLICNIGPEALQDVLRACPLLSALGVFYTSLSEEVIMELLKPTRVPLRHLSLFCERMDKYVPAISEELWGALCSKHPGFSVDIELDHTVPAKKVTGILKPEIPVASLELNTFCYMVDQVTFIARSYKKTLRRLVLQTTSSEQLNSALLDLAGHCELLEEMHCYCVVTPEVVHAFTSKCPRLRRYTLKTTKEPHPWMPTEL